MAHQSRGVPIWLGILIGIGLLILVCGVVIVGAYITSGVLFWETISRPAPCVDGNAGSPAIFRNAKLTLFTFPASASNIESACYTWQSASIQVWFEMNPTEVEPLLESMRWDVRPLSPSSEPPTFGNLLANPAYLYGEYSGRQEGAKVWIDTSVLPHHVYIFIYLD